MVLCRVCASFTQVARAAHTRRQHHYQETKLGNCNIASRNCRFLLLPLLLTCLR